MDSSILLHDREYQRRRDLGWPGWSDTTGLTECLARLDSWWPEAIRPPATVLELGCGAGDHAWHLHSKGFVASGIDASVSAIEWARDKGSDVRFEVGNVVQLEPFEDSTFDWVFDAYCRHCIIGSDARREFLASVSRVLRPGGLFTSFNMFHPEGLTEEPDLYDSETRIQIMNGIAVRYMATQKELLGELEAAGLQPIRHFIESGERGVRSSMLLMDARKL